METTMATARATEQEEDGDESPGQLIVQQEHFREV